LKLRRARRWRKVRARRAVQGLKRLCVDHDLAAIFIPHFTKNARAGMTRERFADSHQILAAAFQDVLLEATLNPTVSASSSSSATAAATSPTSSSPSAAKASPTTSGSLTFPPTPPPAPPSKVPSPKAP
jgi:hypothetical protein